MRNVSHPEGVTHSGGVLVRNPRNQGVAILGRANVPQPNRKSGFPGRDRHADATRAGKAAEDAAGQQDPLRCRSGGSRTPIAASRRLRNRLSWPLHDEAENSCSVKPRRAALIVPISDLMPFTNSAGRAQPVNISAFLKLWPIPGLVTVTVLACSDRSPTDQMRRRGSCRG